jgi:serine/threonine protein phosphatase 1
MGEPAISPILERLTYAVGDVHGRLDLLKTLLEEIEADAFRFRIRDSRPRLIFLGDYIDRGHESAGVLDLLSSDRLSGFETYFLKGNHEDVLLQFLADPAKGDDWKRIGGLETMLSYGVTPPRSRGDIEGWTAAQQQLIAKMPEIHRAFLGDLVLAFEDDRRLFVHAGVRPGRSIDDQTEMDLLWIRDSFLSHPAPYHKTVVHGHTPRLNPHLDKWRVGIDTGAYVTGVLTAARFWGPDVCLISTVSGT